MRITLPSGIMLSPGFCPGAQGPIQRISITMVRGSLERAACGVPAGIPSIETVVVVSIFSFEEKSPLIVPLPFAETGPILQFVSLS